MKTQAEAMKKELDEVEAKKSEYFNLHQQMESKEVKLKRGIKALEDATKDLETL